MNNKKILFILSVIVLIFSVSQSVSYAIPPLPARIGGTVTVDGIALTNLTDIGYTFDVTRLNGTAYNPVAEDTDSLNSSDWYVIDIPIYDATDQPGGAQPGETAIIHVYLNGVEINVTSPVSGQITVGNSGSTNQIDITAQIPKPDITVTDTAAPVNDLQIPFGSVTTNTSSDQTVTVNNDGNADLVIGNIAQNDTLATPFSIQSDNCSGETKIPADSCSFIVRCLPTATGSFSDSFDIPSNDTDENPVTVDVSCDGTPPVPDIEVTDAIGSSNDLAMPFGSLTEGLSLERAVKVTNTGADNLIIGTVAQSDPLLVPFSIATDNCSGTTLGVGEDCIILVDFSSATGSFTDSFDIPSNDPDEDPVTITVSGTGLSSANNNPPSIPTLIYPADGQQGLGTSLTFRWEKSTDPDQHAMTYKLYYSEDANFIGSSPIQVVSLNKSKTFFAWNGIGLSLFGIALVGGIKGRKKLLILLTVTALIAVLGTSCGSGGGGGGGDSNPPPDPQPSSEMTQGVSGLNSGATYYWKVVVDDGNGGVTESDVQSFNSQ